MKLSDFSLAQTVFAKYVDPEKVWVEAGHDVVWFTGVPEEVTEQDERALAAAGVRWDSDVGCWSGYC